MIALVGARNASINAIRHAKTLARELGEAGYVIVSGMRVELVPLPIAVPWQRARLG